MLQKQSPQLSRARVSFVLHKVEVVLNHNNHKLANLSIERLGDSMQILADFFRALGSERRLAIWVHLNESGSACVLDLASELGISEEATSKHLKKLVRVGLIEQNREGEYVRSAVESSLRS